MQGRVVKRLIAWMSPAQVSLVRQVAAHTTYELVAVGSSSRGQGAGIASELGVSVCSDLRASLATGETEAFWLADTGDFGQNPSDIESLLSVRARDIRVITSEPIPGSALELSNGQWTNPVQGIRAVDVPEFLIPRWGRRHWALHADAIEQLGSLSFLRVNCEGRREHGSLGARLLEAMDLVMRVMGEPETVSATYLPPPVAEGQVVTVPESLAGASGSLVGMLRFAGGHVATFVADAQAPVWSRWASLKGTSGQLMLSDHGSVQVDASGQTLEHESDRGHTDDTGARTIADDLRAALDDPAKPSQTDIARLLVLSQCVLLSAKTGQVEQPETIRRMIGPAL